MNCSGYKVSSAFIANRLERRAEHGQCLLPSLQIGFRRIVEMA